MKKDKTTNINKMCTPVTSPQSCSYMNVGAIIQVTRQTFTTLGVILPDTRGEKGREGSRGEQRAWERWAPIVITWGLTTGMWEVKVVSSGRDLIS